MLKIKFSFIQEKLNFKFEKKKNKGLLANLTTSFTVGSELNLSSKSLHWKEKSWEKWMSVLSENWKNETFNCEQKVMIFFDFKF